jgi:hypothetical protein
VAEQCKMVKAEGTGTRCMVYRNTELALQWEETSRAAMTQENVDNNWFLKFKSKEVCDSAAPCSSTAAFHTSNDPKRRAHRRPQPEPEEPQQQVRQ